MDKKITLVAIKNIENIGDELLEENTRFILNKCFRNDNINIHSLELLPTKKELLPKYLIHCCIAKILVYISRLASKNDFKFTLEYLAREIAYSAYFKDSLKNTYKIIYTVGMLKYSTQNQCYSMELINEIAERYEIPVMISGASIQKIHLEDWRCRLLVKAVNYKNIKWITTRDNEAELKILREEYLKNNNAVRTASVGDPALWTADTYGIPRVNARKNDLIGINLIRLKIYRDYGNDISEEKLYHFYIELIRKLEHENVSWVLFCNGMPEDYAVGLRLIKELNLSNDKLLPRPKTVFEFLSILSKFNCVMGARLHSCITSYAVGVPVVGLIWDNKSRAFAKKINWQEYFVEPDSLNAEYVFNKLLEVREKEYDYDLFMHLKQTTLDTIKKFLDEN